jgi:hypothetical protein
LARQPDQCAGIEKEQTGGAPEIAGIHAYVAADLNPERTTGGGSAGLGFGESRVSCRVRGEPCLYVRAGIWGLRRRHVIVDLRSHSAQRYRRPQS